MTKEARNDNDDILAVQSSSSDLMLQQQLQGKVAAKKRKKMSSGSEAAASAHTVYSLEMPLRRSSDEQSATEGSSRVFVKERGGSTAEQQEAFVDALYSKLYADLGLGKQKASQTCLYLAQDAQGKETITHTASVGITGWIEQGKVWELIFANLSAAQKKMLAQLAAQSSMDDRAYQNFISSLDDENTLFSCCDANGNKHAISLQKAVKSLTNGLGEELFLEYLLQEGDGHRNNRGFYIDTFGELHTAKIDHDYVYRKFVAPGNENNENYKELNLPFSPALLDNFSGLHGIVAKGGVKNDVRFSPLKPSNIALSMAHQARKDLLSGAYNVTKPEEAELMQVLVKANEQKFVDGAFKIAMEFLNKDLQQYEEKLRLEYAAVLANPENEFIFRKCMRNLKLRQKELEFALLFSEKFRDFLKKEFSNLGIDFQTHVPLNNYYRKISIFVEYQQEAELSSCLLNADNIRTAFLKYLGSDHLRDFQLNQLELEILRHLIEYHEMNISTEKAQQLLVIHGHEERLQAVSRYYCYDSNLPEVLSNLIVIAENTLQEKQRKKMPLINSKEMRKQQYKALQKKLQSMQLTIGRVKIMTPLKETATGTSISDDWLEVAPPAISTRNTAEEPNFTAILGQSANNLLNFKEKQGRNLRKTDL